MEFYTHFHNRGNTIFTRIIDESGNRRTKIIKNFKPTLYIRSNEASEFKTLTKECLKAIHFDTIRDAKDFIKQYEGVSGFELFGNTSWGYAAINEWFDDGFKYDESKILTWYIDIETEVERGVFPTPELAAEKINLISVFDGTAFRVWSFKDYTPKKEHPGMVFKRVFDHEIAMLQDFVGFWEKHYPDVVTGWNIEGFDIPYIVNRIKNQLGDDDAKRLSPTGYLRESYPEGRQTYTIQGIEILDYLLLFKKFIPGERDFTLDAVCTDYLETTKLENPYSTFKEFYTKSWDLFVDYNIHDTALVYQLEQKLKLLSLTYSIAYLVKMNYSDVFGTVKPWDIFIQNSLYKENTFVQATVHPGVADRQIMGGFVMAPIPGRYEWTVSFDANSLYPSIIRTWNISPETLLDQHEVPQELMRWYDRIQIDELMGDTSELTRLLKKYNLSMTANGQFYRRDFQGVMPRLCEQVYMDRVSAKDEMQVHKKELKAFEDQNSPDALKLKSLVSALDNKQWALKILLNSLYGAMANAYFRFFDFRNAEGITSTGQYFIKYVGHNTAKYIDNVTGVEGSLIYIDTDSNYFSLKSIVDRSGVTDTNKLVDMVDAFCKKKIGPKIDSFCAEISTKNNVFDPQLAVKREKICSAAVWVKKKRYALYVHDSEGYRYEEPDIAITGLEVRRSNTPMVCRKGMEKAIRIVLSTTEADLQEFVKQNKQEFMAYDPYTIARPTGVKGLSKYADDQMIYKKGCPMHVRASLMYNKQLEVHNVMDKYNAIMEGGKMRFVKLKLPNPIREDVIGFVDRFPEEFGLKEYIDYDDLYELTFLKPLTKIVKACKWSCEKINTLEEFFV